MADYTLTSYSKHVLTISLGSFGYVPAIAIRIKDSWGASLLANDRMIVPITAMLDILSFNNSYPTVLGIGGSTGAFSDSSFADYTYPVESSADDKGTYAVVSRSVVSRTNSLNTTIYFKGTVNCVIGSNRLDGRCRPLWLWLDENDRVIIFSSPTGGPDCTGGGNSFENAADNSGLPYGTTQGYTLYNAIDDQIFGTGTLTTQFFNLSEINYTETVISEDPYTPAGTSTTGGGTGSFDLSSDSVDFPSLPTLTAVSTGLVSVYTPSIAQLNSLASFLWNANPTDVDFWKKLVANPLDLILGLSIVPVEVPAGATQTIKVGLVDSGVSVTKAASQFVEVDCGSISVDEYWGSALDYSPFRRFSIYLPFIGTRTISTDDIMGKTVHVKYHVDLLSGACVAMVKCGDAVLYQYSGACAVSLPLSGETFTNVITSTIQLAASIGATVATGGAAAGVTAASAANSLMSMKPIVERAGGVSGAAGQLGVMKPYLIGEVPRQSVPNNCNSFTGYPSNIKAVLGELSGYTEVDIIYIKGIEATQAELDELETVLKGGFII